MLRLKNELHLKLAFELLWNILIVLICLLVVFPIYLKLPDYPFLVSNVLFIIVFLSFFRYIFFLKHTFASKSYFIKLFLLTLSIILEFILIYFFNTFRNFMDEQGLQSLFEKFSARENDEMTTYIKAETIFFAVCSIIVSAILPVRMLISVWRQYNNKSVE